MDFSPDGNYLATGDNRGNIKIWDYKNNFAYYKGFQQLYNSLGFKVINK
jgi:WD40 repeat protein